jgi:hypothetical protein
MNDIEDDIFDACARLVLAAYPDAVTTSKNLAAPATFPAMSIVASTTTDSTRIDSSGVEKGSIIALDIRIFSNLRQGAKKQGKAIFKLVDDYLYSMNFTRTVFSQSDLSSDPSVYLVSAHYVAGVDNNNRIYRRL